MEPDNLPVLITVCGLIVLWTLETWLPAAKGRRGRVRHAARNLSLGLLNAVALSLLAAPLVARAAIWAEDSDFGLLRMFPLPPMVSLIAAVLLFDGWMYLWHRANHQFHFLWRFHRAHHSEPEMDATSAIRFHPGEVLLASALTAAVLALFGITLRQLLVYQTLMLPAILFHHSNVDFPERLDRWLRVVVVSPVIHRLHHSRVRAETDSNYSTIFSFWDRIAGTFRLRRDGRPVEFGLAEYDGEEWQGVSGLLTTPFLSVRAESGLAEVDGGNSRFGEKREHERREIKRNSRKGSIL